MQVTITAVGPDHRGLADPIIHHVTGQGANIAEIQMYDHDEAALFAMLCRVELEPKQFAGLKPAMDEIGKQKGLSIRVWSPEARRSKPRLAICTTYRPEPALALLRAIRDGQVPAEAAVMIGNRPACRSVAEQFGVDWHNDRRRQGNPDDERLIALCDQYDVDYIVLARYMRILSPAACWKYAGGRIINLHHGLLPSFPGMQPYHEAYASRMLTYGATCHFIVPELGRRQSDHLSIDLHRAAGHEARRNHPPRPGRQRAALPGRRRPPRRHPRSAAALPPRGGAQSVAIN